MVDGGLRAAGRVTGVIGTVGVRIADVPHRGVRTTPEATDLQALLAVMRDAGVASVVMEVSSIAIQEHRIDGIHYEVAAFTHLSQDHLDYHGTMEEYFLAKAALFTPERAGRGVVGVDDEWGRRLAQEAAVPVDTWSMASAADWTASGSSSHRTFVGPGGERTDVRVPLPGAYNVANALCAFAMLRRAGVPADAAAAGIAEAEVPGRMQVVDTAGPVRGIVDYAHSPDAIARVLQALRDESDGRLIVVVGAGGDRDRTKRPLMGETAARLADVLVITDDNPRSEDPAAIRAAVREGAERVSAEARAEVHVEGDRAAAVATGVDLAQPGDVLVLLGKGHEQGQEAGGVIVPFDDATVLAAALHARWPR
jgi:UDP-N-acetylmuramoyl-L-alanyl-D-glutamate--2,6-diaminopimelate ligase